MFERLQAVEDRYEQLNELLSDPAVISDPDQLRKYSKEQSDLQETVETYRQYKAVKEDLEVARMMLQESEDQESREMIKQEVHSLEKELEELKQRLKLLLIPK